MTYISKSRGDRSATIVCVYTCPEHGEFDAEVQRDAKGNSPDVIACPVSDDCWDCGGQPSARGFAKGACVTCDDTSTARCALDSTWTPSPVMGRVRRVEVSRGKWEKPERRTYLDTRSLGEGQDPAEFAANRRKIWRDHRMDRARKEFEAK